MLHVCLCWFIALQPYSQAMYCLHTPHPHPSPDLVQIHLLVALITLPQGEIRVTPDL